MTSESRAADQELIGLLRKTVVELRRLNEMNTTQVAAAEKHTVLLRQAVAALQEVKKSNDVLRRRASAGILREVKSFSETNQYSFEETLIRIADDELSFARFGDGEFRLMTHLEYNLGFQQNSPELMTALKDVLCRQNPGTPELLLGFPFVYRNLFGSAIWGDVWEEVLPLLNLDQMYGNSHITRPVYFKFMGLKGVELWRRVWEGLDIRVITGQGSRFEAIPPLFSGVKSISFHYTKPMNAFDARFELLEDLKADDQYALNLIALGPAGTVLTSDLAANGLRAIDIGHLNGSYENVHKGAPKPEHTPPVS